jgi:hypothetical protein
VLAVLLGMRITPLSASRVSRAEALESLVTRRIVDDRVERVSTQVAALLAVLARPRHRIEITARGSTPLVIATQTLTHVVHTTSDDHDVITPSRDGIAEVLSGIDAGSGAGFSLPGRTWYDMVAQARFATDDQLARLAQLDGCDADGAKTAAQLAKHQHLRTDVRMLTYRGNGRWRGSELSWIAPPGGAWMVDDGGRFGTDADLTRRRATFRPERPDAALRSALQTLN